MLRVGAASAASGAAARVVRRENVANLYSVVPTAQPLHGARGDRLNTGNILGSGGRVACAFGELLDTLGGRKTLAAEPAACGPKGLSKRNFNAGDPDPPSAFYDAATQYAPQFGGYDQHDSQEFLSVLLDTLHEDLNRVDNASKPYIEAVEHDGSRMDESVAAEAWCQVRGGWE